MVLRSGVAPKRPVKFRFRPIAELGASCFEVPLPRVRASLSLWHQAVVGLWGNH